MQPDAMVKGLSSFIAHRTETGEVQPLSEHAREVARRCESFLQEAGLSELAPLGILLGILHDIGKAQPAFQRYILGQSNAKAPHSAAGALYATTALRGLVCELAIKQLPRVSQLLAYAISGHHRGLYDYSALKGKLEEGEVKVRYTDTLRAWQGTYSHLQAWVQMHGETTECRLRELSMGTRAQSIIRLLFSCLVDADFLDTETFMDVDRGDRRSQTTKQYAPLTDLRDRLREHTDHFTEDTPVNEARRHFLDTCREHGRTCEKGFYSLFLPTGGGKTLSSMAWALETALHHRAQRIIYVIPYTSIITQTAGIFRSIFGDENVLEHHSDVSFEGSNVAEQRESYDRTRLLAENWDAPIVVTTNVQFFESLFSNKVSRSRKVHNIAGSVIVLDEVQMFPTEYLNPVLRTLEDLGQIYGAQLLFCSATIPPFDKDHNSPYQYKQSFYSLPEIHPIVPIDAQLFKPFERVIYHLEEKTYTAEELASLLRGYPSALCVMNSRKDAARLYQVLSEQGQDADAMIHLSRNMCSAHLKDRLAEVRRRLKEGRPTLVISTQLIEAGVDIDLPIVFRAMSGLDSIIQAGGRCNREGKQSHPGEVFVFSLSDGSRAIGSIAKGQDATRFLLDNKKIDQVQATVTAEQIEDFYDYYYRDTGDFDLKQIAQYLYGEESKHWEIDFESASREFKLIDNKEQYDIFVPYKQGRKLIEALQRYPEDFNRGVMRVLQRYHVAIFSRYKVEELLRSGLLSTVTIGKGEAEQRLLILDPGAYDEALGIRPDNPYLEEPLFG